MEASQCSRTSADFIDVRLHGAVIAEQLIDVSTVLTYLSIQDIQILANAIVALDIVAIFCRTNSLCIVCNLILQCLVSSCTGLGFLQIDSTQCIEPVGYVLVNRIDRTYQIVVDLFDDFILCSISTLAFCPFLCNSLITGSRFFIDIILQCLVCSCTLLRFSTNGFLVSSNRIIQSSQILAYGVIGTNDIALASFCRSIFEAFFYTDSLINLFICTNYQFAIFIDMERRIYFGIIYFRFKSIKIRLIGLGI